MSIRCVFLVEKPCCVAGLMIMCSEPVTCLLQLREYCQLYSATRIEQRLHLSYVGLVGSFLMTMFHSGRHCGCLYLLVCYV